MAGKGKGYSDFDNVESGLNGTTKGLLPNIQPVSSFIYRKDLMFFVPLGSLGSSFTRTITGSWRIQLKDSSAENANVLFEQEVRWRAQIIIIADPFFGGAIGMATWYPLDGDTAEAKNIRTYIVNGTEINPDDAWQYLDNTSASPLSEFSTTIFEPEALVTTNGLYVNAVWQSPPYRVNLPVGAVLDIVFDHWQVGTLIREATYRFGFKLASPQISTLLDVPGAIRSAYPVGTNIRLHHTYHNASTEFERYRIVNGASPSIWKDKTNKMWCGAFKDNIYYLLYSQDDGRTFKNLTYKDPEQVDENGYPQEHIVTIWTQAFKYPHTIGTETDTILSIAQRSGTIYFKTSTDNFLTARTVARAKRSEPYQLISRNSQIIVTNGVEHFLISNDGGVSWQEK